MTEQEMDYFTALYDVARVVNASLDPAQVMGEIVRCVVSALHVKASVIRLLDTRQKRLVLGASFGLSEKYLHKGPILLEESGIDKQALAGKTVWIKDAQKDKSFQYPEMAKAERIKSIVVTPLFVEKKVIGILRVYADQVRTFSHQEMRFLEAVANLSAIALDNARLHETLRTDCDLLTAAKYRIDDN